VSETRVAAREDDPSPTVFVYIMRFREATRARRTRHTVRVTSRPFSLQHEDEATGLVAAVFTDIRRRMAFTPAIFKAFAADPPALERAWVHARAIVDDPRFEAATDRLRAAARTPGGGSASRPVADAVAPFTAELPGMLLIVSSLGLALDGLLPLGPPPPLGVAAGHAPPEPTVPEARGEHPLYAEIRTQYGTEHVPTLYRSLAALGLLDEAWPLAAAALASPPGRARVASVAEAGEREARGFAESACFDAAQTGPVLDQFRVALPRNLVVALALSRDPE
jgi:hypothetical protein